MSFTFTSKFQFGEKEGHLSNLLSPLEVNKRKGEWLQPVRGRLSAVRFPDRNRYFHWLCSYPISPDVGHHASHKNHSTFLPGRAFMRLYGVSEEGRLFSLGASSPFCYKQLGTEWGTSKHNCLYLIYCADDDTWDTLSSPLSTYKPLIVFRLI